MTGNEQSIPARAGAHARQEQAEGRLRSLELFGMRFGLDRMRRMMTVLGSPERSFEAVHVLGTNGKSSTTRMTAAILERHGLRTGAYLSPHLVSYCERVLVGEQEMDADGFADAVSRAAWAAERVNRTLAGDDHVTQFELLTAAAFWHMAQAGVEVAVVEAGLGGRYDATSVLDAPVTVLTNVGLEHTRWLGPTVRDIAEEKLAALGDGAVLVLGSGLDDQAVTVARRVAGERGARIVRADPPEQGLTAGRRGRVPAAQLRARPRRRGRLPRARRRARERAGGGAGRRRDRGAGATAGPGRGPAHDPRRGPQPARRGLAAAVAARAARRAAAGAGARRARGQGRREHARAPASPHRAGRGSWRPRARGRCPRRRSPRWPAQLGFGDAESGLATAAALVAAQQWARERDGAVLVTGSVYLVGEVLAEGLGR